MINTRQLKSKDRVRDHGEVFTADREVNAMLDLVHDEIKSIHTTVLEPACGEGAFLTKTLERKLQTVSQFKWNNHTREMMVLQSVSSMYGIDIQKDNVLVCRDNLARIATRYLIQESGGYSRPFKKALDMILIKNIQCGNTLTATAENSAPLKVCEWQFNADDSIKCIPFKYADMLENGEKSKPGKSYTYTWMKNNGVCRRIAYTDLLLE